MPVFEPVLQMETYILKTLKKIRKETPRRLKQLLTVCDLHIGKIIDFNFKSTLFFTYYFSNYNAEELTQKSGTGGYDALPSKYFEPLQWACESKIPRLMDIAIDALHYMMGTYNSFIHFYLLTYLLIYI